MVPLNLQKRREGRIGLVHSRAGRVPNQEALSGDQ